MPSVYICAYTHCMHVVYMQHMMCNEYFVHAVCCVYTSRFRSHTNVLHNMYVIMHECPTLFAHTNLCTHTHTACTYVQTRRTHSHEAVYASHSVNPANVIETEHGCQVHN
ncbi:hypothetical protein NP493_78g02013 [Ridgeia piscesae]|uniref:Uncharacterized protein n=1 Tax=Ridgeia piscesae TaxID=27915 RepID=A0AAD9P984_RIDPI|nr:hypothetical protein NP493_78g02013 [Ridgeia piscesae]